MVMEHGLGDFSIASLFWTSPPTLEDLHSYESVEEVKERLAVAMAELEAAKEELDRKEQNTAALLQLVRDTTLERDLVHENYHLLLARELEAMNSSGSNSGGSPPLPSSSSPVAVDHPAMFNPFVVPSPPPLVADEGGSEAAELQVPTLAALPGDDKGDASVVSDEGRRASAAALQVPTFAAVVGKDKGVASVVAAEASSAVLALEVPSSAALHKPSFVAHSSPPVAEKNSNAAGAAATAQIEVPIFASSSNPASVARKAAVEKENRVAAAAAKLEVRAGKRPLPQQGRLMQAVVEAGPLLQNLLVTGPLPRWRNPPPAHAVIKAMMNLRAAPMREHKRDGGGLVIS